MISVIRIGLAGLDHPRRDCRALKQIRGEREREEGREAVQPPLDRSVFRESHVERDPIFRARVHHVCRLHAIPLGIPVYHDETKRKSRPFRRVTFEKLVGHSGRSCVFRNGRALNHRSIILCNIRFFHFPNVVQLINIDQLYTISW